MAIGLLGDVVLEVSPEKVMTLNSFTWSGGGQYNTHQRHAGASLTEFTGQDTDRISLKVTLSRELGVDPMTEMTKLWTYMRQARAIPFTLGTHAYGRYRWTITSLTNELVYYDKQGDVCQAEVSLELLEYLSS